MGQLFFTTILEVPAAWQTAVHSTSKVSAQHALRMFAFAALFLIFFPMP
jgi:hypothetical protein